MATKLLPLDKLILETDSPFLIPQAYAKKWNTRRNQPDSISYVVEKMVEITGKQKEELVKISLANTKKLFNF